MKSLIKALAAPKPVGAGILSTRKSCGKDKEWERPRGGGNLE